MNKVNEKMIEQMRNLYFGERLSLNEVGARMGISGKTVEYHLKKKYKLRTRSESLKGREVSDKVREVARDLGKSQVGPKNPTWKGRVKRGSGYIGVRMPNHPNASKDGYVMEHRLIMEKELGRHLTQSEDVHHINEIKDDNRIENLMVIDKSEHGKFHGIKRISDGTHNNYIYISPKKIKEEIEKGGTMKEIADRLNIEKTTLYKKIKRLNLEDWYKNWREAK